MPIGTKTPAETTSTVYYYAAAKRIAAVVEMLGKTDEADQFPRQRLKVGK